MARAFAMIGTRVDIMDASVSLSHKRSKRREKKGRSQAAVQRRRSVVGMLDSPHAGEVSRKRPIEKKLHALEITLTKINHSYSYLEKTRAIAKLVKAASMCRHPVCGSSRRFLAPETVRAWLRQFYGVNLSAAGVGAIVDLLPDYVDVDTPDDALCSSLPARKVDLDMLVLLCTQLGDVSRSMDNRRKGAAAKPPLRQRPKSAPAALRNPIRSDASQSGDESRALRVLMVKLLASALHHEPGVLETIRGTGLPVVNLTSALSTLLHLHLSAEEQVLLQPLIRSAPANAPTNPGYSLIDLVVCNEVYGKRKASAAVSGKKLSMLLYELMHGGLRCSRIFLVASATTAIRRLHDLGFSSSLVGNIYSLCEAFGRSASGVDAKSARNAIEDLRFIAHNVTLAALKVRAVTDKGNLVASEEIVRTIENSLRKLCRSYFAHLRSTQKLPRRRQASLMSVLAKAVEVEGPALKLPRQRRPSCVNRAQHLREELCAAHQERAQRELLDKLSCVRSGIELQRLEYFQQKHMKLAAHLYFKSSQQPHTSSVSICGSRVEGSQHSLASKDTLVYRASHTSKRIRAMSHASKDKAARIITRAICNWVCKIIRRRLSVARNEWLVHLKQRARQRLGKAMRNWLAKKQHLERIASITAEIYKNAVGVVGRALVTYVRKRRAHSQVRIERLRKTIAQKACLASKQDRDDAAAKTQASWRAWRVRVRTRELQAAREDVRMIRVDIVGSAKLLVADTKKGTSDPTCYITAQLGERGGFAPEGMAPSKLVQSQIANIYAGPTSRAAHGGSSPSSSNLSMNPGSRASTPMARRSGIEHDNNYRRSQPGQRSSTCLVVATANFHDSMDKPQSFYLPPTIRARDRSKFEAVPPYFPIFSSRTACIAGTLTPTWDESFLIPGVDPESTVTLTVVDEDDVGKDDFLGQTVVDLRDLRLTDTTTCISKLQQKSDNDSKKKTMKVKTMAKIQEPTLRGCEPSLRTRESLLRGRQHQHVAELAARRMGVDDASRSKRAPGGDAVERTPAAQKPSMLLLDETRCLGDQLVPILDGNHCQLCFERISGGESLEGLIKFRMWVYPRALSICSHLEQRLARNSMVAFWKPSWCALGFDYLLVYNSRGDEEPRFKFEVDHIECVDVLKEGDDEVMMSFKVAGAGTHVFRVPEMGYPNRELLFHAWLRRLRRACPRIPTNEFVPSDCTHAQYLGIAPLPAASREQGKVHFNVPASLRHDDASE